MSEDSNESNKGPSESQIVEDWVARAANGDREAGGALLQHYWKLIEAVIRVRRRRVGAQIRAREDTVDMQQNIAMHLIQELPKHAWQSRRAFIAWMKKVADAKVIDAQRRHMAQKRDAGVETGVEKLDAVIHHSVPGVETFVERRRANEKLEALLGQLKDEYAIAVRMHFMGFTHPEIADVVKAPSGEAARKLVARGISGLQKLGWRR